MKIITYGGIITELHVPGRDGVMRDIVLGFDNLQAYLGPHPYFGAIVGRVAGRITRGKFAIDGREFQLEINDPPNHLHGGVTGFSRRLWRAAPFLDKAGASGVKLAYRSSDGEEGYPGNVDVSVSYLLTGANELVIDAVATTDKATPLSLTSHSYFNLAGEGAGDIGDHRLQIHSDETLPFDNDLTLLGRRQPVKGTPLDFNSPRRMKEVIPHMLKRHGDTYVVRRDTPDKLVPAARLEDPASGCVMEVATTDTCVQLYTAAFLDGSLAGKSGKLYEPFSALCLECEGYPDGVNHPEIDDIILRPGQTYRQTTVMTFGVTG